MSEEKPSGKRRRRRRRKKPGGGNATGAKTPQGQGQEQERKSGDGKKRRRRRRGRNREPREENRDSRTDAPEDNRARESAAANTDGPMSFETAAPTPTKPPPPDPDDDYAWPHRAMLPFAGSRDPVQAPLAQTWDQVHNVVGVRRNSAGKLHVCTTKGEHFEKGDYVVIDGGRYPWVGYVSVANQRRSLKRTPKLTVSRRANEAEITRLTETSQDDRDLLEEVRAIVDKHRQPMKVFRLDKSPDNKVTEVHFTSEERVDFRRMVGELSQLLGTRVEMKQTGVRDRAKVIGGIGTCGQELCCTTWLPDFVPVSIKMAKDQGLVLNPTKVSGQCGRLKCCLVYEQSTYAEMRKGLPKLGKRVLSNKDDREGRVVEVDVLKRRIRVNFVGGDQEVLGPDDIRPMFPAQNQGKNGGKKRKRRGGGQGGDKDKSPRTDESASKDADQS